MKFPRNAKIIKSHFDVAPFAAVFLATLIFLLLGMLLPVPGIPLQPPSASDLPGTDQPTLAVAIDAAGQMFFENAVVNETVLKSELAAAVKKIGTMPTLVLHADKSVSYEQLAHFALLVREPQIGITNLVLATLPRLSEIKP